METFSKENVKKRLPMSLIVEIIILNYFSVLLSSEFFHAHIQPIIPGKTYGGQDCTGTGVLMCRFSYPGPWYWCKTIVLSN